MDCKINPCRQTSRVNNTSKDSINRVPSNRLKWAETKKLASSTPFHSGDTQSSATNYCGKIIVVGSWYALKKNRSCGFHPPQYFLKVLTLKSVANKVVADVMTDSMRMFFNVDIDLLHPEKVTTLLQSLCRR